MPANRPRTASSGSRAASAGPLKAPQPPVALEDVSLPASRLDEASAAALRAIAGEDGVADDRATRVLRAAGRGYPDLVRLRAGNVDPAPDAVVRPRSHAEVRAVLEHCADAGVAVVPFGGGTSVVGGVEPDRGAHASVIALDLGEMSQLLDLDETLEARDVPARPARPGGRARAARARPHAGPLPAELRVRDGRRLGGDALSGPGVDRLRADRRARRRADARGAGGRRRAAHRSGQRGGAGPAAARDRQRGRARRDHERHAARAPAPEVRPLRGLDDAFVGSRGGGLPRPRAGRQCPGRRAAVRPHGDRDVAGARRPRRA